MAEKITDKLVRRLQPPAKGNAITYDTEQRGFGVRVTAGGAKAFILNYRADGRERRYTIGAYPDWSVVAARDRVKKLRRAIDSGRDPMGDRHAARDEPTMTDLIDRYQDDYLPRKTARSQDEDRAMIRNYIRPAFGKMQVANIRLRDVEKLHRTITKRTPIRANRCLSLLSRMFSLAIRWDMTRDNPAQGLERNPENKRERFLSQQEIADLSAALDQYSNQVPANAVRLLMLTGARRGEVLKAKWTEIDFERGIWTKPRTNTKQRKDHKVPLSAPALQLLAGIKEAAHDDATFIFPGRVDDSPMRDIRKCWESVAEQAELKDVRLHDLRHTFASLLVSGGATLPLVGAMLGHTQPQTTARYAHLYDSSLREAAETVGRAIVGAKKPSAEVVQIAESQI